MRGAPALDGGGQEGVAEAEGGGGEGGGDAWVDLGVVTVPVALRRKNKNVVIL